MKALFIILLCHFSLPVFAQEQQRLAMRDSLYKKSKNQKTAAWILLGAGGGLTIAGLAIVSVQAAEVITYPLTWEEPSASSAGDVMIVAGLLSMAGSIPLFIASGRNREKAYALSVSSQQIVAPLKGGLVYQYQPAISLRISIGRN